MLLFWNGFAMNDSKAAVALALGIIIENASEVDDDELIY